MQHNKYEELRRLIHNVEGAFVRSEKTLESKINKNDRLVNGMMGLIKDYETQISTLKTMLFEKGVIQPQEFEAQVDTRRGLRIKADSELVEAGDVVWVDYHASIENDKTKKIEIVGFENGMPVRVGSKAVAFEDALIGRRLTESFEHIETIADEGALKGKQVKFTITVRKIKTKLKVEAVEDGQTGTTGDRRPDNDSETAQPDADVARQGHQPDVDSQPVAVQ